MLTRPGAVMLRDAEGRETGQSEQKERMVSLRHVSKQKQDREKGGTPEANLRTWAAAGVNTHRLSAEERAEKERAPNHEDYKHEGEDDKVNTEIRCTKGKIVTLEAETRVETVGKTYLGLDAKNDSGPKVATEGGLAKQTWAKV